MLPPFVPLNKQKGSEQKALRSAENNERNNMAEIEDSDEEGNDLYYSLMSIQSLSIDQSELEVSCENKTKKLYLRHFGAMYSRVMTCTNIFQGQIE